MGAKGYTLPPQPCTAATGYAEGEIFVKGYTFAWVNHFYDFLAALHSSMMVCGRGQERLMTVLLHVFSLPRFLLMLLVAGCSQGPWGELGVHTLQGAGGGEKMKSQLKANASITTDNLTHAITPNFHSLTHKLHSLHYTNDHSL